MVYAERYVGFWLSFLLPTIMFMFCPLVLLAMHKKYNLREPTDSVFGKFLLLTKHACKDGGYKHIGKNTFWSRVKPSRTVNKPKWMTFDGELLLQMAMFVMLISAPQMRGLMRSIVGSRPAVSSSSTRSGGWRITRLIAIWSRRLRRCHCMVCRMIYSTICMFDLLGL